MSNKLEQIGLSQIQPNLAEFGLVRPVRWCAPECARECFLVRARPVFFVRASSLFVRGTGPASARALRMHLQSLGSVPTLSSRRGAQQGKFNIMMVLMMMI